MNVDRAACRSLFAIWRWPRWAWAVVLPLLIVSYPLSIGPVAWLERSGILPPALEDALAIAYLPLGFVADQSEIVSSAIVWYVSLWVDVL